MNPSPNYLYYISQAVDFLKGYTPPSLDASTQAIVHYVQLVEWAGLAFSVLLLGLFIWYRLRTGEIEYAMQQQRLHEELEFAAARRKAAGKNPRWLAVDSLANSTNESDWRRAIIEGDSMLADMLRARGFSGGDIGEMLRGATETQFGTLDLAWEAHRLRNRIAHEGESLQLTQRDAQAAIDQYRRVFEEFDYI